MRNIDKFYDKKVVKKPWGYEYVVYRKGKDLSVTLLKINYKKKPLYIVIQIKKVVLS